MPSVSKKQRRMFAIAEHNPEMLYERNKGAKEMSKEEMHKYASTKEAGLPLKKKLAQRKISKA
jgi:hypothetical protein